MLKSDPGVLPEVPLSEEREHADAGTDEDLHRQAHTVVTLNDAKGEEESPHQEEQRVEVSQRALLTDVQTVG